MSNPLHIIGLCGLAGAGKDTVGKLLHEHAGFYRCAFADALRAEVAQAFCIPLELLLQRETKEHPMSALALSRCLDDGFVGRMIHHHHTRRSTFLNTEQPRSPRQILQWWGTEYRRSHDPAYWVKKMAARIAYLVKERLAMRFVITDLRFGNEVVLVRNDYAGQIWQISRPGWSARTGHESEVDGSAFAPDLVIDNRHDIRHLQGVVLDAVGPVLTRVSKEAA